MSKYVLVRVKTERGWQVTSFDDFRAVRGSIFATTNMEINDETDIFHFALKDGRTINTPDFKYIVIPNRYLNEVLNYFNKILAEGRVAILHTLESNSLFEAKQIAFADYEASSKNKTTGKEKAHNDNAGATTDDDREKSQTLLSGGNSSEPKARRRPRRPQDIARVALMHRIARKGATQGHDA